VELDFDGVKSEFLENSVEFDLVWGDGDPVGLEGCDDFWCADATVEVAFFVRVGFDIDRLLADLVCQSSESYEPLFLDCSEFLFVLFNHPLVVVVGNDGETFWEKVVVRVPWFDFDDLAGLSKVFNVLDEHQLDAAVRTFWKAWELRSSFFASRFGLSCHDGYREAGC